MTHKTIKERPFLIRATLALIGMAGVWLLAAWFLSAPPSSASGALPRLTFWSPVPPVNTPQLNLVKTVDDDTPQTGDEIVYTLTYSTTNPGSQAFNVRLYDFLPPGVELVSTNPSSTHNNGTILFTAPSAGATNTTATVRVRVKAGYAQLYNHALVTADGVTPAHASLLTAVEQTASQLQLTKTGYGVVLAGDVLVYTLRCQNTGDEPVTNVTVVDVLPTGLPLVAASPTPDVVTLPMVRWSLGTLGAGAHSTVVLTTTAPASAGIITNTALADGQQALVTHQVFATQVITEGAILRVSKQGSADAVDLRDELVYTLRYENAGDLAATGVVLTDTLPSEITVTGVYPPATSQTTQHVTWDLDTLAPDASGQRVITVTVGGSGGRTLHNVADVAGSNGYPDHVELDIQVRLGLIYMPLVMRNS